MTKDMAICEVESCGRLVHSRSWCNRHYENLRRYGYAVPKRDWPLSDRLVDVGWDVDSTTGCWEWRGTRNEHGYGVMSVHRLGLFKARAHRLVYEVKNGPIPPGIVIRHRCDNPPCVNPAHLVAGTQADNARDMADRGRRKRDFCPAGHDRKAPGAVRVVLRSNRKSPDYVCVLCDHARKAAWAARNPRKRITL